MHKKNIFLYLLLFFGVSTLFANNTESKPVVFSITVNTNITPFISQYIKQAILATHEAKAEALLINLDTPGGLLTSTREIVQNMLVSPVPILVYISPAGARAGSAGVFITLAANIAAMAPSTNIGAAHPVGISGGDIEGDMKKKVEEDASAWARSIAETRGKNAEWAAQAVESSKSITAIEALNLKVIDLIAADVHDLLENIHGRTVIISEKEITLNLKNAVIQEYPMSANQEFMKLLSNPNLIYILLLLGILGIFIEFKSPGLIAPGLIGVLCLATVFGVEVLPINWFGVLLIFGAVAFFVAEIFITSMGLLTIAGLTLLIFGSYLLFDVDGSTLGVDPWLIWLFASGFTVLVLAIGFALIRAKRQGPTSNIDAIIGTYAMVREEISPQKSGRIFLNGTSWRAESDDFLTVGQKVKVIKVKSTLVYVEKIKEELL